MPKTESAIPEKSSEKKPPVTLLHSMREYIEALGIALVLAFIFKAFVVELYCIPTGSMAPTLMGRHKDVNCEICGFPFQLSASQESNDGSERPRPKERLPRIVGGTCPQCQFTMYLGEDNLAKKDYTSFNGDRIFVNKSLFSFEKPSRWHVTVFRYPAKPQINYIKRLIGLENETIMLRNGQVFVQDKKTGRFNIQRKPLRALLALLRPVDDNDYVVPAVHKLGWKTRWYGDERWTQSEDFKSFTGTNTSRASAVDATSWLKFRYIAATTSDWYQLIQGRLPENNFTGTPQLITDYIAYNSQLVQFPPFRHNAAIEAENNLAETQNGETQYTQLCRRSQDGVCLNWVGDIAVRCSLKAEKPEGFITFRLVKGGINFQCEIDIPTGNALFSIPEVPEFKPFTVHVPIVVGRNYEMMFCNIDEEMRLIVDGKEIDTQSKGQYDDLCVDNSPLSRDRQPTELDLEPAAIGIRGTSVTVEHLKIERSLYYISSTAETQADICDLIDPPFDNEFSVSEENVRMILSMPEHWKKFGKTRRTIFELGPDQFLMCGDNSAQSKDSRLWTTDGIPHYVDRKYLIGEAILVFWPRGYCIPGTNLALIPNFADMRWIN